ncbi:hypothetical protein [Orientia tsutsugamushi]
MKNGLIVQIDLHRSHNMRENLYVHMLATTREFNENGEGLSR